MRLGKGRRRTLEGDEGEPSVLVLQEGPSPRRRRLLAALLVGALLVALFLGADVVERWTGVEVPGPESVASLFRSSPPSADVTDGGGAADPGAGAVGTPEVGAAAPTDSGATAGVPDRRLDSLEARLDSLALSLDRYRERHGDFVRGRLGCVGLSRGFTELENRSAGTSRAFEGIGSDAEGGAEIPADLLDRYRRLSSAADSLAGLFAGSGCGEAQ